MMLNKLADRAFETIDKPEVTCSEEVNQIDAVHFEMLDEFQAIYSPSDEFENDFGGPLTFVTTRFIIVSLGG